MCLPNAHNKNNQSANEANLLPLNDDDKRQRHVPKNATIRRPKFTIAGGRCQNEAEMSRKSEKTKVADYLRLFWNSTQSTHTAAILSILTLALALKHPEKELHSKILSFVYLSAFSSHVGSQFWMTFVSGLSLYLSIPRHHFGNVQKVLFPRYFLLNAVLSLIVVWVYTKSEYNVLQVVTLSASFLINILIRVYLAPILIELIAEKTRIEEAAGIGMEIGKINITKIKDCPHYGIIYKRFRKIHMSIAIGNIAAMGCSIVHLIHLSDRLCLI